MGTTQSKKYAHELNVKVSVGCKKHCAKNGGMIINRVKLSANEISRALDRRAAVENQVTQARAALAGAVMERERVEAETQLVFDAVRSTAMTQFCSSRRRRRSSRTSASRRRSSAAASRPKRSSRPSRRRSRRALLAT
jgi:hypothetical protein